MWKKRLIWRNELVMCKNNGNVSNDTDMSDCLDTKSDRDESSSSGDLLDINTAKVSVRNGEFVPDTKGSLLISFHYMLPHNNNNSHDDEDTQQMRGDLVDYVPDLEQEAPLDLSLVKVEMKEEAVMSSRDRDSGYNPSPPLVVDLTSIPDEDFCSQAVVPAIRPLPDHLVARYPYLRLTNTGALVLWNFLWALVQDNTNAAIVRWVSITNLEFQIVDKIALAEMWGRAKRHRGMDWNKVRKILDLYLRKKLLKLCSVRAMVYQFQIVPRHVRPNHVQ